ncbi:MAG: glycosyltransferase [Synechococcales cyanobacterium RM1_1_8]|nr:glycosyltransferase [Synechococcales cyanobacterium RM1_1_8]
MEPVLEPATEPAMERLALDVIIPVRDRSTVVDCVTTLREQASQARGFVLGRILLCDGGSREADCRSQLAQVNQWHDVEVLHCGSAFDFNKGWLLNQGIATATAPLILISDVDILWNTESLEALAIAATSHPHQINAIQSVVESRPQDGAVQRPRYGYRIEAQGEGFRVEVYAVDSAAASSGAASAGAMRPGCGLICARRSRFQDLGGYGHGFRGWGWEDQDFLMRAQLSGCAVGQLGWVMHLSHGDGLRNRFAGEQMPQASRDQNIRRCLAGLAQGRLLGDLPGASQAVGPGQGLPISVVAPPELADFLVSTQD